MPEQFQLDFTPRPPAPASASEVDRLCSYLEQHPGTHTARELIAALGFSKRKLRQLAEKSDSNIVSAPGRPGYKHLRYCTLEEIEHATAASINQAKLMIRRAIRTRKKAHAILR